MRRSKARVKLCADNAMRFEIPDIGPGSSTFLETRRWPYLSVPRPASRLPVRLFVTNKSERQSYPLLLHLLSAEVGPERTSAMSPMSPLSGAEPEGVPHEFAVAHNTSLT